MDMVSENMVEVNLTVNHEHGLHARPADLFVRCANQFKSSIAVYNLSRNPQKKGNAKGILGILSLGVRGGDTVKIVAAGEDSQEALAALVNLVESNFKE